MTSKEKLANTLIEYTHFTSVKYYCEFQNSFEIKSVGVKFDYYFHFDCQLVV